MKENENKTKKNIWEWEIMKASLIKSLAVLSALIKNQDRLEGDSNKWI